MKQPIGSIFLLAALAALTMGGTPARAAEPTTLSVFAAGTLAVPFKQVDQLFEKKYPDIAVQPQFGGSVKMARQITDLHQDADILAVADYNVIPKYLFGGDGKTAYADWYVGFVRNAITYTPSGGIVSISLNREDASHLAITVADTGLGIPPEDLARVFDRFYRTDASRTRASGGFGLGLSIARDLVQAMGGTISAASAPGEGSQFRVVLRIA